MADEQIRPEGELPAQQCALDIAARKLRDRLLGICRAEYRSGRSDRGRTGESRSDARRIPSANGGEPIRFRARFAGQARSRHAADRDPFGVVTPTPASIRARAPALVIGRRRSRGCRFDLSARRPAPRPAPLPVAIDPGHADHLPAVDSSESLRRAGPPRSSRALISRQPDDDPRASVGVGRVRDRLRTGRAAEHHRRPGGRSGVAVDDGDAGQLDLAADLPPAEDGHPVRHRPTPRPACA